jgi:DNA-binding NtrC family response regulator
MPKKKVIIVDDEPIVCERLKAALERHGFDVEAYIESQKAIDTLMGKKFDFLITDLKMPKPTGMEILNFVKQHSPSTRVIIITAYATVETAREAIKDGAVDFIPKPFKISDITDLITKLSSKD